MATPVRASGGSGPWPTVWIVIDPLSVPGVVGRNHTQRNRSVFGRISGKAAAGSWTKKSPATSICAMTTEVLPELWIDTVSRGFEVWPTFQVAKSSRAVDHWRSEERRVGKEGR